MFCSRLISSQTHSHLYDPDLSSFLELPAQPSQAEAHILAQPTRKPNQSPAYWELVVYGWAFFSFGPKFLMFLAEYGREKNMILAHNKIWLLTWSIIIILWYSKDRQAFSQYIYIYDDDDDPSY